MNIQVYPRGTMNYTLKKVSIFTVIAALAMPHTASSINFFGFDSKTIWGFFCVGLIASTATATYLACQSKFEKEKNNLNTTIAGKENDIRRLRTALNKFNQDETDFENEQRAFCYQNNEHIKIRQIANTKMSLEDLLKEIEKNKHEESLNFAFINNTYIKLTEEHRLFRIVNQTNLLFFIKEPFNNSSGIHLYCIQDSAGAHYTSTNTRRNTPYLIHTLLKDTEKKKNFFNTQNEL